MKTLTVQIAYIQEFEIEVNEVNEESVTDAIDRYNPTDPSRHKDWVSTTVLDENEELFDW